MKITHVRFLIVILGAGAVGALTGSALEKMVTTVEGATTSNGTSASLPASGQSVDASRSAGTPLSDAGQSADPIEPTERSATDPGERALLLLAQAEAAPAALLPDLLRQAKGVDLASTAVATSWAKRFPEDMFRYLEKHGNQTGRPSSYMGTFFDASKILFDSWVLSDPRGAAEMVTANPLHPDFRSWVENLWPELTKHEPELAFEFFEEMGAPDSFEAGAELRAWISRDPEGATKQLTEKLGQGYAGRAVMVEAARIWGDRDPLAALAYAEMLGGKLGQDLSAATIAIWTHKDPTAAMEFVAEHQDLSSRSALAKSLLHHMKMVDPEVALTWAQHHLRSEARVKAVGKLISEIAQKDIDRARDLVTEMEIGGTKDEAAANLIFPWMVRKDQSIDEIFAWIATLPDAGSRNCSMRTIDRIQLDMEKLNVLLTGDHWQLATRHTFKRVAELHVEKGGPSAVAWAKSLPEDRSAFVLKAVMDRWRNDHPDEARQWEASNASQ